jgi:hypothetical protein
MGKLSKVMASLCLVTLLVAAAVPALAAGIGIAVCWTNCPGPGFER